MPSHVRTNRRRWYVLVIAAAVLAARAPQLLAAPPNKAPTVAITSPASGATFVASTSVAIQATATDRDGTVTLVEFFQGATKLGQDATAPFAFTWSNVPAGSYALTAVASDNQGAKKTSKTVNISVSGGDTRATVGEWSSVVAWPDIGIHLTVLPSGYVLSYSDDDDPGYPNVRGPDKVKAYVILNPDSGVNQRIDNGRTNLFCSGHVLLRDGRVLAVGGHEGTDGDGSKDSNFFDYRLGTEGQWQPGPSMQSGRWYPSACTLGNGDVVAIAGSGAGTPNVPEVWQAATNSWRSLTSAALGLPYYPRTFLFNSRVFVAGPARTSRFLDPNANGGAGAWTTGPNMIATGRDYGASVMYDVGKVLAVGGADPPLRTAEVIDLNQASPSWRQVGSMAFTRRMMNATLLADGSVLATGGTSSSGFNNAGSPVYAAELWKPSTETWSTMASMQVPRLYHSSAVLLPDGRVLSAGGGRPWATGELANTEHRDAEIFSPPYLFKGPRPVITTAPASITYGSTFTVYTPNATSIAAVTFVRLSSTTHSFNMNQRFHTLASTPVTNGVAVTAPPNASNCPPGHYLLFLINAQGVPSVASIVQIQ